MGQPLFFRLPSLLFLRPPPALLLSISRPPSSSPFVTSSPSLLPLPDLTFVLHPSSPLFNPRPHSFLASCPFTLSLPSRSYSLALSPSPSLLASYSFALSPSPIHLASCSFTLSLSPPSRLKFITLSLSPSLLASCSFALSPSSSFLPSPPIFFLGCLRHCHQWPSFFFFFSASGFLRAFFLFVLYFLFLFC